MWMIEHPCIDSSESPPSEAAATSSREFYPSEGAAAVPPSEPRLFDVEGSGSPGSSLQFFFPKPATRTSTTSMALFIFLNVYVSTFASRSHKGPRLCFLLEGLGSKKKSFFRHSQLHVWTPKLPRYWERKWWLRK
jgi:hypothetical protein